MYDLNELVDVQQLSTQFTAYVPRIVAALLVMLVFWLILRVTRLGLRHLLDRARIDPALSKMLVDRLYTPAIYFIAIVTAAAQLGVNVTTALAGLGVAGVAIGFAAQDSLANVIAGFLIFWDKPFGVGDYVTVQGEYGRVTEITMRSTRIRTQRNTYVVIPNRSIIDSVLVNHTKHGEIRVEVPIGIAHKESINEARRVILMAIEKVPAVEKKPAADVVATGIGPTSVELLVRVWIADATLERQTFFRTLEASKLALDTAGIEIPRPNMKLLVDDVEDRVWRKAAGLVSMGGAREV
jgi:small conductance mechanosensitive channel